MLNRDNKGRFISRADEEKAQQIEQAWSMHRSSQDITPKGLAPIINPEPKLGKVIFANRDEINECAIRTWLKPQADRRAAKREAELAAKKAEIVDKVENAKAIQDMFPNTPMTVMAAPVLNNLSKGKYVNLADLQRFV